MLNAQEKVIDRLVSIIRIIQLERSTGTLRAWRGEETMHESGTIVFSQGKVVQAKAGHHKDRDALNWLSTWGTCRMMFVPSIKPGEIPPQISSPTRTISESAINTKQMQTGPNLLRESGPLPSVQGNETDEISISMLAMPLNQVIPYRIKQPDEALYLIKLKGLSRLHFRLFLLIDGEHSIIELMTLLKLDELKVFTLLHDLQEIHCTHISSLDNFN